MSQYDDLLASDPARDDMLVLVDGLDRTGDDRACSHGRGERGLD